MVSVKEVTFHSESGVTLVEMLVVIVIISIVAALALMQGQTANVVLRRQNVSRELKVAFERARIDSVKRRALASPTDVRAKVVVGTTSYTLTTYPVDSAGVATASSQTTNTVGQNVAIRGYSLLTLPYTVYFNNRGEAVDSTGTVISTAFYVCQVTCNQPADANADLVVVMPTGTVNLLSGGSTLPTFNAPGVSIIPGGTGIRSETFISPTPTP